MRSFACVVLVAACGDDPSLRILVDHPEGSGVAKTVVTVYESASTTCEDIEYGTLDIDQLQALIADDITIEAQGAVTGDLDAISRTGRKLIVARGFDVDDQLRTAGCVQHDEVVENDKAAIATVLAASVSVGGIDPGGSDPGVEITITDATGMSIAKRHVSWRVYAPIGTEPASRTNIVEIDDATWQPAQPACTNNDGRLRLRPVQPDLLGGFAFTVNASWSTEPPRLFASFTKIDPLLKAFTPSLSQASRWCANRIAGNTRGLVCIEDGAGPGIAATAVDYIVTVAGGRASILPRPGSNPVALGNGAAVVYSVDRDDGKRDVYSIANNGGVTGLFAPSLPAQGSSGLAAREGVTDAIVIPKCAPGQTPKLLLRTTTVDTQMPPQPVSRAIRIMEATGGPMTLFHGLMLPATEPMDLRSAGCVTQLVPGQVPIVRQVAVLDIGRTKPTKAYFDCDAPGGKCKLDIPVSRSGVGFIGGDEPRMVGAFFDASGTVLSSWVLVPDATKANGLVERARTSAASLPQQIAVGQLDDDNEPDLIWNLTNLQQDNTNFQVSYSRMIGDARLSALTGTQEGLVVRGLFTGDVTEDGYDDVIILGEDTAGTSQGVTVIPTHVAPPGGAQMQDVPCNK